MIHSGGMWLFDPWEEHKKNIFKDILKNKTKRIF